MRLAPVVLPVNQFDHFYRGGNRIGALRHGPGGPRRPEEWIASTTARFGQAPQGFSALPDGKLLIEHVEADPVGWLGSDHVRQFGVSTELLVKLLDLDQRLPVHVHPNRAFARRHLGLAHGKTEAWYVLKAPEGARAGVGFAQRMTRETVRAWVAEQNSEALLSALQTRVVRPGDALLIPAGLPHTVGAGVFVLELQEPTDLSILLEWQGFAIDGARDGHLDLGFDVALGALNLDAVSESDVNRLLVPREEIEKDGLTGILPASADTYFRAHRFDTSGSPVLVPPGFAVLLVMSGAGVFASESGSLALSTGMAIVVPHEAGGFTLHSESHPLIGVVCRPPAPSGYEVGGREGE